MDKRSLVYSVFELSYPDRMRLFTELDLLTEDDKKLPDEDMIERAFKRVVDENKYDKLVEAVGRIRKPEIPKTERKPDRDLYCQKCKKTVSCRFQPSPDAGPFWRCPECSEVVECSSLEVEKMLSEATSLWYSEYHKVPHQHCPIGHPGHEGCPGGVPCVYEGPAHHDIHVLRSIIFTLGQVLKMKLGDFCCQRKTRSVPIPKCRHGSPAWCNICGEVPPVGLGLEGIDCGPDGDPNRKPSDEEIAEVRQKMRDAPSIDLDLHMGGEEESKRGKAWLEEQENLEKRGGKT